MQQFNAPAEALTCTKRLDSLWLRSGAASLPYSEPWVNPGEQSDKEQTASSATNAKPAAFSSLISTTCNIKYFTEEEFRSIFCSAPCCSTSVKEKGARAHLVALDQQSFQPCDFGPQLSDQADVAVLVDGGLVNDVLGSIGVAESAERLAVVHVSGGNG